VLELGQASRETVEIVGIVARRRQRHRDERRRHHVEGVAVTAGEIDDGRLVVAGVQGRRDHRGVERPRIELGHDFGRVDQPRFMAAGRESVGDKPGDFARLALGRSVKHEDLCRSIARNWSIACN
jgi:hypothetical protein